MTPALRPKVLFLCGNNSARSQLGEALLQAIAGDVVEVYSAGIDPRPVHPLVKQVLAEVGIDFDGRAKDVKEFMGRMTFAFTITVCDEHEDLCPRLFPGSYAHLHWPVPDPVARMGPDEQLAAFRLARNVLADKLATWWPTVRQGLQR